MARAGPLSRVGGPLHTERVRIGVEAALAIPAAIRNLMEACARLEDAVAAATSVPARAARRNDVGSLRPGSVADVVVLEGDVEVSRVFVGGVER